MNHCTGTRRSDASRRTSMAFRQNSADNPPWRRMLLRAYCSRMRSMHPRSPGWCCDGWSDERSVQPSSLGVALVIIVGIGVGIARTFVLAIRIGIEKRAVPGLGNHLLRRSRHCAQDRQGGRRANNLEGRHFVSPILRLSVVASLRIGSCADADNNTDMTVVLPLSVITPP